MVHIVLKSSHSGYPLGGSSLRGLDAHLVHCSLDVPGVSGGHGLKSDGVLAANLDLADLQERKTGGLTNKGCCGSMEAPAAKSPPPAAAMKPHALPCKCIALLPLVPMDKLTWTVLVGRLRVWNTSSQYFGVSSSLEGTTTALPLVAAYTEMLNDHVLPSNALLLK